MFYFLTMKQILLQALILHISWHKSRIECFVQIIAILITDCSIYTKDMAIGITGKAKAASKLQRVYRLLREQIFDYDQIAKFIVSIFAGTSYIIALDRTCWKFGKSDINILFLVIVVGKISVPVYWRLLDRAGACSATLMQDILSRFINTFGVDKIKYLLADREFMNREWLQFLNRSKIKYAIPLRKDMKVRMEGGLKKLAVGNSFNYLKPAEHIEVKGILWSYPVKLSAHRNDKGELMVIASSGDIDMNIFSLYRFR